MKIFKKNVVDVDIRKTNWNTIADVNIHYNN